MNKQEKVSLVENIKGDFSSSELVILFHYRGIKDKDLQLLRSKVRQQGAILKIAKNTLVKRAIFGTEYEILSKFLFGPIAVTSSNDPTSLAKVITNSAKENSFIDIKAGFFAGSLIEISKIKELSNIGSFEELRSKFLSIITAPQSKFVRSLNYNASSLLTLIDNYSKLNK